PIWSAVFDAVSGVKRSRHVVMLTSFPAGLNCNARSVTLSSLASPSADAGTPWQTTRPSCGESQSRSWRFSQACTSSTVVESSANPSAGLAGALSVPRSMSSAMSRARLSDSALKWPAIGQPPALIKNERANGMCITPIPAVATSATAAVVARMRLLRVRTVDPGVAAIGEVGVDDLRLGSDEDRRERVQVGARQVEGRARERAGRVVDELVERRARDLERLVNGAHVAAGPDAAGVAGTAVADVHARVVERTDGGRVRHVLLGTADRRGRRDEIGEALLDLRRRGVPGCRRARLVEEVRRDDRVGELLHDDRVHRRADPDVSAESRVEAPRPPPAPLAPAG